MPPAPVCGWCLSTRCAVMRPVALYIMRRGCFGPCHALMGRDGALLACRVQTTGQRQPEQKQQRREGPSGGGAAAPAAAPEASAAPVPAAQPQQGQEAAEPALSCAAAPAPSDTKPQQGQQAQPQQPLPPSQQPAVVTVSQEQMQLMFQRALRQEITYEQLEAFLKQHNLLPSGPSAALASAAAAGGMAASWAGPPSAAPVPAALPAPPPAAKPAGPPSVGGVEPSFGLEDMKSIEVGLPVYSYH